MDSFRGESIIILTREISSVGVGDGEVSLTRVSTIGVGLGMLEFGLSVDGLRAK